MKFIKINNDGFELNFFGLKLGLNYCTSTTNNYKIFLYICLFNKSILDVKANTDVSDYDFIRYVYLFGKELKIKKDD
jgi:hypothetical protein